VEGGELVGFSSMMYSLEMTDFAEGSQAPTMVNLSEGRGKVGDLMGLSLSGSIPSTENRTFAENSWNKKKQGCSHTELEKGPL